MSQYIALPLVGFVVGLLIISLGGGGGAVYVGILTVFFHIPPGIAASTSLATTIPTTAVGTFSHWKAGNVNWRFGLTMLIGGVAGAIIGSLCSGFLPESLYNKVTGAILLLLAVQMLVSYIKKKAMRGRPIRRIKNPILSKRSVLACSAESCPGLSASAGAAPLSQG